MEDHLEPPDDEEGKDRCPRRYEHGSLVSLSHFGAPSSENTEDLTLVSFSGL